MEEIEIHPKIGSTVFKLRLFDEFKPYDILNEHLIVLSNARLEHDSHVVKVDTIENFEHNSFLYKYSQYLHFNVEI